MSDSKKFSVLLICLWLSWPATTAFAAMEYIRAEGTLTAYGVQTLGGEVGQYVYFDLALDTDIVLSTEDDYAISYFASWIAGTYGGTAEQAWSAVDASSNFYRFFWFQFDGFPDYQGFYLGEKFPCYYDYMEPYCQDPLAFDWEVGDQIELRRDTSEFYEPYAFMEVTYRGTTPPPPIPLPASVWLLLSAIGVFTRLRK